MGELTILETIKGWIGHLAWKTFLWSANMTEEEFHIAKYEESIALGDPRIKN